jgi:hypothetical protein
MYTTVHYCILYVVRMYAYNPVLNELTDTAAQSGALQYHLHTTTKSVYSISFHIYIYIAIDRCVDGGRMGTPYTHQHHSTGFHYRPRVAMSKVTIFVLFVSIIACHAWVPMNVKRTWTVQTQLGSTPVGNLHGQNACFLPLEQLDQDYYAPRIVQVCSIICEERLDVIFTSHS